MNPEKPYRAFILISNRPVMAPVHSPTELENQIKALQSHYAANLNSMVCYD